MSMTLTTSGESETEAGVNAGALIGLPQAVNDDYMSVLVPAGARVHEFDLKALEDRHAPNPRRKKGEVHVQDAASFINYIAKHGLSNSEVWADPAKRHLVGVINAPSESDDIIDEGTAGHSDHRVVLELIASKEWATWVEKDKKWMDQQSFAEFLEDNAVDVIHPDAAAMLEIAQTFHATTDTNFKSATRLHSGEVSLVFEEQTGARAGQKGDMEIPTEFSLALAVYAGDVERVEIIARFRYRIRQGVLSLSYALVRPDDHARDAFDTIVETVHGGISQLVFLGRPN